MTLPNVFVRLRRMDLRQTLRQRILYRDADLLVVDKPAGLPTQATLDPKRPHLYGLLCEMEKQERGDEAYLGLHHRLDRDTSGVIAFTCSRRANAGLAEQVSRHQLEKVYVAVCARPRQAPPDSWDVRNHLRKFPHPKAHMRAVQAGGDLAETAFRVLQRGVHFDLVEARPRTGRMHQIRVHLSDSGHPICGDFLYAAKAISSLSPRILLHALELHLKHPVSGQSMTFRADLPKEFTV